MIVLCSFLQLPSTRDAFNRVYQVYWDSEHVFHSFNFNFTQFIVGNRQFQVSSSSPAIRGRIISIKEFKLFSSHAHRVLVRAQQFSVFCRAIFFCVLRSYHNTRASHVDSQSLCKIVYIYFKKIIERLEQDDDDGGTVGRSSQSSVVEVGREMR